MPNMNVDYFDPRILMGVIEKVPLKSEIFTGFFREQAPSPAELFELVVKSRTTTMIPAIKSADPGSMRQQPGVEVNRVAAPRFRLKRAFNAVDRFVQPAGTNVFVPVVNQVELAMAEAAKLFKEEFANAVEIMCCQAMVHGKIDLYDLVDGVATKTFSVDFRRPADHNVVLTGSDRWDKDGSDLQKQIDAWSLMMRREAGSGAGTLLLGVNAYAAFRQHPDVKGDLDVRRFDVGSLSPAVDSVWRGRWFGLDVWVINNDYVDIDGETKEYLDPDYALLVAKDQSRWPVLLYAMPYDNKCKAPTKYFAKMYEQEDPSGTFVVAESRPLPWPQYPGWVVYAKVVGD